MEEHDQIIALLKRIEENQLKALQIQESQLAFAKDQLEMSTGRIKESMDLQRLAMGRQAQVLKLVLPVLAVLVILFGYVLIKWRVL